MEHKHRGKDTKTRSVPKHMGSRTAPRNLAGSVMRPAFNKGTLEQKQGSRAVLTMWDEMLVCKAHPGQFNVPYVAGMNCTNLPTGLLSVSNSIAEADVFQVGQPSPLGTKKYTLLAWCPSVTAFSGSGTNQQSIPPN